MKILFLSDNYPPENNANARIVHELATEWIEQGLKIDILTGQPNFPLGKIFQNYKNYWYQVETPHAKLRVIRVKTYMAPNQGVVRRLLDFGSFMVSACFFGVWQREVELIVAISPQFFTAVAGCFLALVKRKPFVFILCDLWPDAVVSTGAMRESWLIRAVKKLELFLYRRASLIVCLSPYYQKYLSACKIPLEKTLVSISGVNTQIFYQREKDHSLVKLYGLQNKWVCGYLGTLGLAHNHIDFLKVARELMEDKDTDFHLFLLGEGAQRAQLVQYCEQENLSNVSLESSVASYEMPRYWSIIDLALVTLKNIESNKTVIPSKMLEAMAMGKPILLYAPHGEAEQFLYESQAGCFIHIDDIKTLKTSLINLKNNPEQLAQWSKNALAFAQKFTRQQQALALANAFERIVKPS